MRKEILKNSFGITRFTINKRKIEDLLLPIIPIEKQKQIVNILDKFDELTRELTRELTNRKKQYEYYRSKLLNFD